MKIDLNKVLITGIGGMVGSYADFGVKVSRDELDVTNLKQVLSVCRKYKPQAIIHLAAETDLDRCERDPEHAYMVNAIGTYNMAMAAKELGIKLVYVSTAGVFDGTKKTPYNEKDIPNPQNYYGTSKFLGELAVQGILKDFIIVRVCWMFGGGRERDQKFVAKIIKQLDQKEIKVVTDQIGSPTFGKDLVSGIKKLLIKDARGIYNLANKGVCSRYELAEEIVNILGKKTKILRAKMSDFGMDAKRTYNEGMVSKTNTQRSWQKALKEYIKTEWLLKENEEKWKEEISCRSCGKEGLVPMLDLGTMPPANAFLHKKDMTLDEDSFPLRLSICPRCLSVQLHDTVNPQALFKRDYYYFTGASTPLVEHFEVFGEQLAKEFSLTKNNLVVEMGSNDGVLLSAISPYARVLGVDPALNVGLEAKKRGVPTMQAFFGQKSAKAILKKEGKARLILGNNVFAHIADSHDVLRGVKSLLSKDGQFIVEVHWVGNLMGDGGFDQIYHEHIYYFSLHALKHLVENIHSLTISKVELIPIHGESLRVYVSKDKYTDPSVAQFLKKEKVLGLKEVPTYLTFASRVRELKNTIFQTLTKLRKKGKRIVGYGAPGKGNTLLNFVKIGPDLLDYIIDTTPTKQGTYTPGMHIPVVSPDILKKEIPDYILLLSWNYADAILEKEKELRKKGVKFIIPVPKVKIV